MVAPGEQRFVSVGTDSAGRILVVVYTHRGGTAKLLIGLEVRFSRETGSMTALFGGSETQRLPSIQVGS
jgi:hypothetical protein